MGLYEPVKTLPAHERARLALRLKPVIAERAKENKQEAANKMNASVGNNVSTEICENVAPIDTQKEIAKIAGVSHDTIAKVEKIERKAPEAVKKQLRTGEISINKAYNAAVMRFTSLYSVLVRKHITLYLKPLKPLTGDFRGATINI